MLEILLLAFPFFQKSNAYRQHRHVHRLRLLSSSVIRLSLMLLLFSNARQPTRGRNEKRSYNSKVRMQKGSSLGIKLPIRSLLFLDSALAPKYEKRSHEGLKLFYQIQFPFISVEMSSLKHFLIDMNSEVVFQLLDSSSYSELQHHSPRK